MPAHRGQPSSPFSRPCLLAGFRVARDRVFSHCHARGQACHALLTCYGTGTVTVATRETHASRPGGGVWREERRKNKKTQPFKVHDFDSDDNAPARLIALLPASQEQSLLTAHPLQTPAQVPAVIKLNCYRSCGTSALAQPAQARPHLLPR